MAGTNVETQTQYRDDDLQSCAADMIVPEDWQLAQPDPWVLAGCPVGFESRGIHFPHEANASRFLYTRPKVKASYRTFRYVNPNKDKQPKNLNRKILEGNRLILEPFLSSSIDDLEDLEQAVSFRASNHDSARHSAGSTTSEASSAGTNWLASITQGLNKHIENDTRPSSEEVVAPPKFRHRIYSAYLGRHGKILTPRCDPLLVGRMERANAVVLLQRCLRGRAAQIKMARSRLRILQLYPELNALENCPPRIEKDTAVDEMAPIKAFVQAQLYKMFTSLETS